MDRAPSTPVRMVSSVVLTCVVAAAALALTYGLTAERIEAQERAAEERALSSVRPGADEFLPVDDATLGSAIEVAGETPVYGVWSSNGAAPEAAGWAVRVGPRGYGGPINMVIGLDRNGLVTGVSIITQNETPGLGTKVMTEPGFLEQFVGWNAGDIDESAKSYDAISGATKSSNGVRRGVLAAGYVYEGVLRELAPSDGEGGS